MVDEPRPHTPEEPIQPKYRGMEDEYRSNERIWGPGQPAAVLEKALPLLAPGKVLDLGAGDGRQALYLAREGFDVTAVDVAPTGLSKLNQYADELGLGKKIHTEEADISRYHFFETYPTIICIQALHFLEAVDYERTIEAIQAATDPGGINVIGGFTENGTLRSPETRSYWPTTDEMKVKYVEKGWEILSYDLRTSTARAVDEDGNHHKQEAFGLIARKPIA